MTKNIKISFKKMQGRYVNLMNTEMTRQLPIKQGDIWDLIIKIGIGMNHTNACFNLGTIGFLLVFLLSLNHFMIN